ncbi:MAG: helix-turn-helix domain-containing protein [Candidatus Korarchaeota archaeon]|nr:helix-turn-helix domain-containing protein [Candidatus Korarchaeota archaeon]NIU82376.1 helix-turn-helix domain-containing protein [Candidatus Thorarchaeota archaeon]NIW12843.1 helix-turn-helix domain-containing protein [Candidatus Thorarchaeota archaeon]NIW51044.1 helix-turn-helix domain-containing protein [Candidatus Korarchaeota archaeon]
MVRQDYRSHVGVILTILEVIDDYQGAGVTEITRDANLPYSRAKTYLQRMEEEGYLDRHTQGRKKPYELTKKGKEFLKTLKRAEPFFESLGFPL